MFIVDMINFVIHDCFVCVLTVEVTVKGKVRISSLLNI